MTRPSTAAPEGAVVPAGEPGEPIPAQIVAAFEAMIADIPEAGGDAFASILGSIATAQDVLDLDAPWRSAGLEDLVNVPMVVLAVRKMPSDYQGGLPWFLVVDAATAEDGERITFTTGAVSVVAQLAKAWAMGALPLACTLRQSERPSRSGYYPQHLDIARRQPARAE